MGDYLDEDPPIRRQKFVCVSILTPDDVGVRDRSYFQARAFAMDVSPDQYPTTGDFDAAYESWCSERQTTLDDGFKDQAEGKPHIPIMKVRGAYKTLTEAKERCRFLSKTDLLCDIYVAPVGRWVPADGKRREDETSVEYAEKQMQELMKQHTLSQAQAKAEHERRRREAISDSVVSEAAASSNSTSPSMTDVA